MPGTELTPESLAAITGIDRLVHQPARLSILTILYVVEGAGFPCVKRRTGLTGGNLSSHISKLESAGYVQVKKEFVDKIPHSLLSLTPEGREAFQAYRQRMKRVLEGLPE